MPLRYGWSLLCVAALSAQGALAQPSAPSNTPHARHRLSPRVSAAILAGIRYEATPFIKAVEEPSEAEELPDGTIRLPRQKVFAQRDPVFTESELYGSIGKLELARQRYLSAFHRNILNRYRISRSDDAYALAKYEDDNRVRIKENAQALAELNEATGDKALSDECKRLYYDTQQGRIRELDFMTRTHLPR